MAEEKRYKIVVTKHAKERYQLVILEYLFKHFALERALEIDISISKTIATLERYPLRGTKEKYLEKFNEDFRYILYRESRNFEIKIIFFVDESIRSVVVTDFFPTMMHPAKLIERR